MKKFKYKKPFIEPGDYYELYRYWYRIAVGAMTLLTGVICSLITVLLCIR